LFRPDDPLAPRDAAFDEAWHAQTLAIAETMIKAQQFSATDWANALGAALKSATQAGAEDTAETYYLCALKALETLTASHTSVASSDLTDRKQAWEKAYRSTPHGKPVTLGET